MEHDDHQPGAPEGAGWRWPFSRGRTIAGGGVAAAICAALLAGAYVGPLGGPGRALGPAMEISHYDPKPPAIDPGAPIEVMDGAPDDFQGLPPEPESEEGFLLEAFIPSDPMWIEPPRMVRIEAPPPPAPRPSPRLRRYSGSDVGDRDCTWAESRVEAMLCRDSRLAAADRVMNRALERIIDDGADPRLVLRDQAAWERARERAAVDGVVAVERLYEIRIDELEGGR